MQVGADMMFAQIPAYLEFFGFPLTTPDVLRSVARLTFGAYGTYGAYYGK